LGLGIFDEVAAVVKSRQFVAADGTGLFTVWDLTPSPSRIDTITIGSSDVILHYVDIWMLKNGVTTLLGSVNVQAGAGYGGNAAGDGLQGLILVLQTGIVLDPGAVLQIAMEVAVTAAFSLDVTCSGGLL
jgi:hypothetical protein